MGNLSCVSCNSEKEENQSQKPTNRQTADDAQAVSANDVRLQVNNIDKTPVRPTTSEDNDVKLSGVTCDVTPASKTSALHLYHLLKSHNLNTGASEPVEEIEQAAHAIVDMSLYITTQVIYPAYLRWLKEDHPEEYRKHLEASDSDATPDLGLKVGRQPEQCVEA